MQHNKNESVEAVRYTQAIVQGVFFRPASDWSCRPNVLSRHVLQNCLMKAVSQTFSFLSEPTREPIQT